MIFKFYLQKYSKMNLPRRYTVSYTSARAKEKQSKANLEEKPLNKKQFINSKDEYKIEKITDKNIENLQNANCVTVNPAKEKEEKKTFYNKTSSIKKTDINYDSYKINSLNSK